MSLKKSFLKSKTILGILVTAAAPYAPAILAAAGVENPEKVLTGAMAVGGALLAAYGRAKATKGLKLA
jgi:hypothetical protein